MLDWLTCRNEILEAVERRAAGERQLAALHREEAEAKARILAELIAIATDVEAQDYQPLRVVLEAAAVVQSRQETNAVRRQLQDRLRKMQAETHRSVATTLPAEILIHYTDYAYWYARWHETEPYRRQIDYWQTKLAAVAAIEQTFKTDTGADVHTPGVMSYLEVDISAERYSAILGFALRRGITPYVVFMAAVHLALSAHLRVDQFMVYSPVAGRPRQELEESVGLFVNMVTVVSRIVGTSTVDEFVHQIGHDVLEAHANSGVSMMAMMQNLKTPLPALPSAVLNLIDLPNTIDWALPGLTVTTLDLEREGKFSPTGVYVYVQANARGVDLRLGYNTALFRATTGQRLALLFSEAIDVIVTSPASSLGSWLVARRG
jgi:hypothetical protein